MAEVPPFHVAVNPVLVIKDDARAVMAIGGVLINHDTLEVTPLALVAVTTNAHGVVAVTDENVAG